MPNALGHWPNAPLVYVLAQIQFSRIPKMAEIWEEFHSKIFDLFPESSTEDIADFRMDNGEPVPTTKLRRWHAFNTTKRTGVIVDPEMLVLHATEYDQHSTFFETLSFILHQFKDVIPSAVNLHRVGLRYVDLLLPTENLSVNDMVVDQFRILSLDNIGAEFDRNEIICSYEDKSTQGRIVIRYRQSKQPNVLPGDVFPNALAHSPLMQKPKPDGANVGMLDYDHFIKDQMSFNIESTMDFFKKMQASLSNAFLKTTTKEAQALWKTK